MFDDILVVTYTPDQPGKGGSNTGFHSFPTQPWLDTRELYNVTVARRRWYKDKIAIAPTDYTYTGLTGTGWSNSNDAINGSTLPSATYSVHPYISYNSTNVNNPSAEPVVEVLSHNDFGTFHSIWSHLGYSYSWNTVATWSASAGAVPAEFLNIGRRCFYTLGGAGEGRVRYRTASGSAGTTDYVIGIPAPPAAMQLTLRSTVATVRVPCFGVTGGAFANSPTNMLVGCSSGVGATADAKSRGSATVQVNLGTAINIQGSSVGQTVSVTTGSYIVSFASGAALNTALGATRCEGLAFNINGQNLIIAQQGNSPVADICATNEIALAEPYLGASISSSTGWSITGSQCVFGSGTLAAISSGAPYFSYKSTGSFSSTNTFFPMFLYGLSSGPSTTGLPMAWSTATGPQWAYSFFDPNTGHISNISPTVQAGTLGASTFASASFATGTGLISEPDTDHSTRFNHLLPFRTITQGGSVLFPIGSLQPYFTVTPYLTTSNQRCNPRWRGLPNAIQPVMNPTGTGANLEDCYPDTELLESGSLIAPQFTNDPPRLIENGVTTPLYPKFWEFWDGRLWMAATQDPRALHYSCDRVQCQFGLPEESFPDINRLVLPAADGFVRGLELVGNMLVITTDRYAYYIAGNNETNYRLMRLSTDMYGVGEYQMAEFTGETENTSAVIVFIGRDKRVYMLQPGSESVWISQPIQDQLDGNINSLADYQNSRVHTANVNGRKRIIIRTPLGSGMTYNLFIFDMSTSTWSFHKVWQNGMGDTVPDCFATLYGGPNVPITEMYVYKGMLRAWLTKPDASDTSTPSAYITIFPSTIDGNKTRKQIQFVRVYGSFPNSTGNMWAYVYVDEATQPCTFQIQAQEDTAYSIFADTASPVDGAYVTEKIGFPADADTSAYGFGPPLVGYRFVIKIILPIESTPAEIFAVQVGYKNYKDQNEVDP